MTAPTAAPARLMVHGDCTSSGCYAMTDAVIEEIYILAREALPGGQAAFQVQAYPFRMTAANMAAHKDDKWIDFWKNLKEGYDYFEISPLPPKVAVCEKRYLINASFTGNARPNPAGACPPYQRLPIPRAPAHAGSLGQAQEAPRTGQAARQRARLDLRAAKGTRTITPSRSGPRRPDPGASGKAGQELRGRKPVAAPTAKALVGSGEHGDG